MKIPFSPPDIGQQEIAEVTQVLQSGWITTGPKTKELEEKIACFCGTQKAVCLNSATAALELTLRIMGVGPGDEVITTAYTYTATASCICHVGATPVLVDTKRDSYEMDPAKVAGAITKRTKAIICVDLGGVIYSRYPEIYRIVEEKKALFTPANARQKALGRILVMADGAHALGAKRDGRMCGQHADFTCFSFHAVKNLTTAEGGAATWSDQVVQCGLDSQELYRAYMLFSLHGQSKDALAKSQLGQWEYDVVGPYYKCNMTDIAAGIGLAQLKRYPALLSKRRQMIEAYNQGLADLPLESMVHYDDAGESSGHLYLTRMQGKTREDCNAMIVKLAEQGIATNVHYKPLPLLTAYKRLGFQIEDFPNAYRQFENEITLPLHTCLTKEQVDYVVEVMHHVC